jgi:hypothetical protein
MSKLRETSIQSKESREATSQPKSPGDAPMEVSDDKQDEALIKLNKNEL